ncbi:ABI gene family member 3-like isoform X2 [Myxocyprinus asiaticus]|uniref:ABI gene family member 3-like isoform X2 n=1 Tax=Myxocyprinus asiaticus TaxID=70543 RepID=UPI002223B89C|nr:ABI gene family member 3-like isoform X2 [Myxocyprinus asiaticus]
MKDQNYGEEIKKILEEGPSARKALVENYDNLHKVAEYCERNYLQSGNDTDKALEETKAFTTQSLASVAYQISSMATNVLKLLEAQTLQLRKIESSINQIGQTVDMHREKVARREIGVFTVAKRVPRNHKIVPPAKSTEPKPEYSRIPISFSSLDSIGHGVKDSGQQQLKTATMTRSSSTMSRGSHPPEPVQCPMAPTLSRGASINSLNDKFIVSSFGKAVPPPVVPSWPTSSDGDGDISSTLLDEGPPPPPPLMETEGEQDHLQGTGPPPPLDCADIPPPPPMPTSVNTSDPSSLMTIPPPPPAPPLETVAEENGFPLPGPPIDMPPPPTPDGFDLPEPPPLPGDKNIEDFEIPAPPPSPPVEGFDDFEDMPPLPHPIDYDMSAPADYLEKVVALYSYDTGKLGDLVFQEGDIICLTSRNEDGWCEGVLHGVKGYFPGNYVESTT